MNRKELLEQRLGEIAHSVAADSDGLALLALGSVGAETERMDEWSDLDFFVIVAPGAKKRFVDDIAEAGKSWLDRAHPVSYRFKNTADGYKLLFADGVFAEMAVFEPGELEAIPFAEGRVVWSRAGFDSSVCAPKDFRFRLSPRTDADYIVGELLTCLYVGLCRYRRGEVLSAWRFVQSHCLDRVLELAELWMEAKPSFPDLYSRDRRVEFRYPDLVPLFESVLTGYRGTPESARALLAWVEKRSPVNAALKAEILKLAE